MDRSRCTQGFEMAQSDNLPEVDLFMMFRFIAANECFNTAEVAGAKVLRSGRENYGDNAIGYVELKRVGGLCTVQAKIRPEHRVKQPDYRVSVVVNEQLSSIESATCLDCVAHLGGCKHIVAFLSWLNRRTMEPSPTEVSCYWKKSKLSRIGTNKEFATLQDFGASSFTPIECTILKDFIEKTKDLSIKPHITKCYIPEPNIGIYSLLNSFNNYVETSGQLFLDYCSSSMTDALCKKVAKETVGQAESRLWHEIRFARITASKMHEASRCTTLNGMLVEQILGCYKLKDTQAMARGRRLENQVIKTLEKNMECKFKKTGIHLNSLVPFLGASPDAINEHYVVEVKCPSSAQTMKNYISEEYNVGDKCMAQIQMQMYMCNKRKAILCIASPEYETNESVLLKIIDFDQNYCENLIGNCKLFWLNAIYPKLINSIIKAAFFQYGG